MVNIYDSAALKYRPNNIKVLFIAESPPVPLPNGKKAFFYFEECLNERFFATIIKAVFGVKYRKGVDKVKLLTRFMDEGYWLIDAVQTPINKKDDKKVPDSARKNLIRGAADDLIAKIENLKSEGLFNDDSGIILIKKTVFNELSPILKNRYWVLNKETVEFPRYPGDCNTIEGIKTALRKLD